MLIVDVTPPLGPAYTLLAFVIVITGGLGSMPGALLGGVLIGLTEAMAGLLFTPSAKSMFAFAILVLVLLFRPQGIMGKRAGMIARLLDGVPRRALVLLAALLAALDRRAVVRQRLSAHRADPHPVFRLYRPGLEHHDGLCRAACRSATRSMSGSAPIPRRRSTCISASARGSGCSWRCRSRRWPAPSSASWRSAFGVAGVYFAILTIAFAEFARVGFDHFGWTGGSAGLFLPVAQYTHNDLWHLRGQPVMFYYVLLALTVLAFVICRALLQSRVGYFWLAIREDEEAARSLGIDTFRYKMVAVVISAGMTAFAGVIYAFYYNNLFPEQVFHISRSIEIILGPIIGGIGTLFGPILGAFVLTGLSPRR